MAKLNSVPKGSKDLWPALRTEAKDLAKQVAAGDHDAYLTELGELEGGHGKRDHVLDAIAARSAKLGADKPPAQ